MPTPIPLPFPSKGVNRHGARSEQVPQTCWDALNFLPYDRYDRLRGGQRAGTAKLQAGTIGNSGGSPVQRLDQVTVALDTLSQAATSRIVNETFQYANGALDTAAPTLWRTASSTLPGYSSASSGAVRVTSNKAADTLTVTSVWDTATYKPTLALGSVYALVADMDLQTNSSGSGAIGSYLLLRVPLQDFTDLTTSFAVFFRRDGLRVVQATNLGVPIIQATLTFGSPLSAGVHTCEVRVNGDTLTVYVDSVLYVTYDMSTSAHPGAVNTGVGFGFSNGTTQTVNNFQVFVGNVLTSTRQSKLLAVAGGSVYLGTPTSGLSQASSGGSVLSVSGRPQSAWSANAAYFVDGKTSIQKLNLVNSTVQTYTPTAGSETAATLGAYTLMAIWRDRLVLASTAASPQNFIMSRVGTLTDWDYSQTDPAAAFAGNASTAGHIGEPILALIPISDDVMVLAGDHNLWAIHGDPADGGSIDLISDSIGILGPDAWAKAPDGTVYFVGTTGFFRMSGGGSPELLSDQSYNQYFAAIDRGLNFVSVAWDRDRHGAYVFVTPANTGTATHLFFDQRNGGFWPIQFPDSHGPTSALVYDGDSPTDRTILLGGRTGYVQLLSTTATDDDGTAITSRVVMGPVQPAAVSGDAVVTSVDVTLGENYGTDATTAIQATWTVKGGKSAYEVTEGTPRRVMGGTFTAPGRQLTRVTRLRGGWFTLTFSNSTSGKYFSLERVVLHVEGQGRQR